ncbi:MAG: HD domain-containing phosphohydrolase [Gemmatimonadaceae bacterium]
MVRYFPIVLAGAAGALYARERRARIRLERLGAATLETLLDAIDANNADTGAHVRRVANYALLLADAADVDEKMKRSVERVALFHDIGKIDGALTDIINETTKLTPQERREIMTHPRSGARVLEPLSAFYPDLADGVLSHHEWWNGKGYPRKLKGTRIPFSARIVAIADTFDAITHSRSYRDGKSIRYAANVISNGRATQFDPDLVDLFLSPPVIDSITASMRKVVGPRRAQKTRRAKRETQGVPDITFRWRTPKPPLLKRDR